MPRSTLSLTGLLVCLVAIAFLFAAGGPTLARIRSLSRRDQCAANLSAITISAKIYSNDNQEKWPSPAFRNGQINNGGIDYLDNRGSSFGDPTDPGEVGFERQIETTSETQQYPDGGSTTVSVTRALWLLVRSGDLRLDDFVCPASRDQPDPSFLYFDQYYDFSSYHNISYAYQVPFGPRETRPREGADIRQVFMADKGPYYLDRFDPTFTTRSGKPITTDDRAIRWRPYNSPNHDGIGQNCAYSDGTVLFSQTPAAGVHADNIYTLMTDDWSNTDFNRTHGESPHYASVENPYPGQYALGAGNFASTDSLLYP